MEKEHLIQIITEAFADVSREDGVTLHEAMALDDRLPETEVAKARHYLPVYMIADIQDEFMFLYSAPFFSLTKISAFSQRKTTPEMIIEKYDFNATQAKAIAAYIQHVQENRIGYDGKADTLSAEQWRKYL